MFPQGRLRLGIHNGGIPDISGSSLLEDRQMKVGESVLDRVVRHLKRLNSRITNGEEEVTPSQYAVTIRQDGSGSVHEDGAELLTFRTLSGLLSFLEAPMVDQVKMIRSGSIF